MLLIALPLEQAEPPIKALLAVMEPGLPPTEVGAVAVQARQEQQALHPAMEEMA